MGSAHTHVVLHEALLHHGDHTSQVLTHFYVLGRPCLANRDATCRWGVLALLTWLMHPGVQASEGLLERLARSWVS